MCGIAASFAYDRRASAVVRNIFEKTCGRMGCRGPDGSGLWISADGRTMLGHRRLAIIDLSQGGAQPMVSAEGRYVITFNGEIYNYQAIRARLERKGVTFRSHSDTEVLLQLYAERGAEMVHELRGMFAFAIWDGVRRGMLLARDPFGIKPLYYADDGRQLRVASEVKALIAGGGIDTRPEPAGHVGFYLWGSVPEPYTTYVGVKPLPAGSTLWIDEHGRKLESYANVTDLLVRAESPTPSPWSADYADELREALLDSVRHHLVADVPVGLFLSAGLDSTTLAGHVTALGGELRTVTLGFAEYRGTDQDETILAEKVAKQYGGIHRTAWITRSEFQTELPRLIDRMDQPTIDGVNTYFVARAAAETGVKVALSGVGGDELFGGYPSFAQIPRLVRVLRRLPLVPSMGVRFRMMSSGITRRLISVKAASILEYGTDYAGAYLLRRGLFMPWELPAILGEELAREGLRELAPLRRLRETESTLTSPSAKVRALEASWYMRNQLLRDTDWASMTHSVEVRLPLVDWELWKRVTPLLSRCALSGKLALGQTVLPSLPEQVLSRSKTGFAIPTRDWLADMTVRRGEHGMRGWARFVGPAALT